MTRRTRAWMSAWVAAGALALLAAMPAGPARAAHVACGDAITADTTLDGDLLACPGNGLVIRSSGVVLDLGGHVVGGSGGALGIIGGAQVSNVTVRNGAVRDFHNAIVLGPGAGYVVRDVTVSDSHDGVLLFGVTGALVTGVSASGNDGSGITAPVSSDVTIVRNHVFANSAGVGGVGLDELALRDNVIERNLFYGARFGQLTRSDIAENVVRENGEYGLRLEDGSSANALFRNRVAGTIGDGVSLSEDSGHNLLERNVSDRNSDDGFAIGGTGAALIRNSASRNVDLGFEAPAGAAFADRNKARHNGNDLQCAGIMCR